MIHQIITILIASSWIMVISSNSLNCKLIKEICSRETYKYASESYAVPIDRKIDIGCRDLVETRRCVEFKMDAMNITCDIFDIAPDTRLCQMDVSDAVNEDGQRSAEKCILRKYGVTDHGTATRSCVVSTRNDLVETNSFGPCSNLVIQKSCAKYRFSKCADEIDHFFRTSLEFCAAGPADERERGQADVGSGADGVI